MWKATLKGIAAHRVRLVLSMVAVMLGVTFVTGTYVLTDTLDRSYDGLFSQTVANVDVVVRLQGQDGPEGTRERFSEQALDRVRAVEGVEDAYGVVAGYAQFVGRDGEAIRRAGRLTLGVSWAQPGARGPLKLIGRDSRAPSGPGEVAMDVDTARDNGFAVGDRVRVLLTGPAQDFEIVGLFGFGDRVDIGALTYAAFDLETAQQAFGAPGQLDAINVVGTPGVDPDQLRTGIATALGSAYEVQLADDAAADAGRVVRDLLELLTALLLGFAAIGVVIAALLVFNTFTIVVAQRTRELGLLRVIGASRAQVVAALALEALVVGVVASVIGLFLGIGVAAALLALVEALGFEIPAGGLVVELRTVIVAIGVGVVVTVAAALWPAVRASREAPVDTLSDVVTVRQRSLRRRAVLGGLVLVSAVPVLVIGLDRTRHARNITSELGWVALGALLVLFGVVILLATFAGRVAGAIGRLAEARGVTARLARENSVRNPRRTAATASALVIGLALVSLVAIFGASTKASVREAVDRGIRADVILKAQQFAGFSPAVAERVSQLPDVEAVSPLQFRKVRVEGAEETVASALADGLAKTVDLQMVEGSIAALEPDGILLHEDAARDYGVRVGDPLSLQMTSTGFFPFRVAGIYRQSDFTGGLPISFIIPRAVYLQGFGIDEQDSLVYVKTSGDEAAALQSVERALADDFPNVEVLSRETYRDDQERAIDRFLAITVALLLLSVVIAVLGIVNTLALSVFERTRELGLLRAVGMSRAQVRQMIRGESMIIAALGAVVGIAVGLLWGWVFTTALEGQGVTDLDIPVLQLVLFLVLAVLAGVVAAWFPARRASRLDVLTAIAAE
jgi:putative ABC transport system permease protein